MNMSIADFALIVVFIIISVIIGLWAGKGKGKTTLSYLQADKNVSLPVFIMTNVATWYGGILGVGEFSYQYGILNWFTQGLPYYIFAILYAFLLVGKIKLQKHNTIPALIYDAYGEKSALLSSVFIFILTSPAPYILMSAFIFVHVFQISLTVAILLTTIITIVYLFKGGYKSDLLTDIFFFFVMFIGFACVLVYFVLEKGGIGFLEANLPARHLQITGGAGWGYIAIWYMIAIWTFADPGFFQRVQSAKSIPVARNGIVISVLLWFVFDFLTNGLGLYARALMPDLKNSADAFLQLADGFIPQGLRGVFYIGLFATILSTLNSFFFISAVTFSQDIVLPVKRLLNKTNEPGYKSVSVNYVQAGLIVTGVAGIILAISIPSVISLWYVIGSICIPPVLFILLSVYYPFFLIGKKAAVMESLLSFLAGIFWWALRANGILFGFMAEIEPMIFSMTIALLIHTLALMYHKYYKLIKP